MNKPAPVLWLFKKIRKRLPALGLMTVIHLLQALLGVAFALGTRGVIDAAIAGSRPAFLRACLVQAGIIAGILLCLTLFRLLRERLLARLDRDWKGELLHSLLCGEYAQVSAYHSGELLNRLNNDVRTVDEGLVTVLPDAAFMVTKLIAAVIVLAALEPWFTLLVVLAGVAVVLVTGMLRRTLKELHKRVSEADGTVSGFLQETMEKLLMVQAMDVSDEMERRADRLMEERYHLQRRRRNAALFANTSVSVLSYGAGFAALVWCAFGLLNGRMTFGSLTAVTQLVGQLQGPFVNLSGIIPKYVGMVAASERLMELDELRRLPAADTDVERAYREMRSIKAEGVRFSYDRDLVLEHISFAVPKGSFTVITGPSGIGKSTILKLLLGIFCPEAGTLELEGAGITLDRSTRKLFAYVPQGNLLLSGTLKDNLLLTRPHATEEELQTAIWASGMEEYLDQLPAGLNTVLGESGAGLSEGQAQRLAIARAVLSGAPVLLLDEITSSLDAETERTVLQRIRTLPGRTCIAVTHRPAALEQADYQLEVTERGVFMTALHAQREEMT